MHRFVWLIPRNVKGVRAGAHPALTGKPPLRACVAAPAANLPLAGPAPNSLQGEPLATLGTSRHQTGWDILKRFLLRLAIYLLSIIGGTIVLVLIVAAFPWLPGAIFLALLVFGFLGGIVAMFGLLNRAFWWV